MPRRWMLELGIRGLISSMLKNWQNFAGGWEKANFIAYPNSFKNQQDLLSSRFVVKLAWPIKELASERARNGDSPQ